MKTAQRDRRNERATKPVYAPCGRPPNQGPYLPLRVIIQTEPSTTPGGIRTQMNQG
ncbi:hypothetical protein EV192_1011156 [Actinocrispum wychmicini]|uniref:Uncharacterized protein n=1 Tax=Actinocrispum wychmicini TaxID=1213861 RepID=A0A4R2JZF8_9PSEU|nr:hypothetical protein EV192_1011156 [Actinocrispum wychmicini]